MGNLRTHGEQHTIKEEQVGWHFLNVSYNWDNVKR